MQQQLVPFGDDDIPQDTCSIARFHWTFVRAHFLCSIQFPKLLLSRGHARSCFSFVAHECVFWWPAVLLPTEEHCHVPLQLINLALHNLLVYLPN